MVYDLCTSVILYIYVKHTTFIYIDIYNSDHNIIIVLSHDLTYIYIIYRRTSL
jgi:hypothetical protein